MGAIIIFFLLIVFIFFNFVLYLKKSKKSNSDIFLFVGYIVALFVFVVTMTIHSSDYYTAIDPIDGDCYTPLAGEHVFSMLFYFIMYQISAYFIWQKGRKLPPLFLVTCLVFLFLGIIINIVLLIQICGHDTSSIEIYGYGVHKGSQINYGFFPAIALSLIIGVLLIIDIINVDFFPTNSSSNIRS